MLSEGQKFGYVNSEFILKNMKEYSEAMNDIDLLSKAWLSEDDKNYLYSLGYPSNQQNPNI